LSGQQQRISPFSQHQPQRNLDPHECRTSIARPTARAARQVGQRLRCGRMNCASAGRRPAKNHPEHHRDFTSVAVNTRQYWPIGRGHGRGRDASVKNTTNGSSPRTKEETARAAAARPAPSFLSSTIPVRIRRNAGCDFARGPSRPQLPLVAHRHRKEIGPAQQADLLSPPSLRKRARSTRTRIHADEDGSDGRQRRDTGAAETSE